jgi:flagellar biosynthesis protein FlhF
MRLRTFNAPDMKLAMRMIREAMGNDAIIISTSRSGSGEGVVVTAATETIPEPRGASIAPPVTSFLQARSFTARPVLERIETTLRFHSTPDYIAAQLLETARHLCLQGNDEHTDFTRLMAASFQYAPLPLDQETYALMLVGAPGTGKTMTIAKMASQVVMEKKKPVVITTDNKRAGGVEQLSAFTTILGITLHVADNRGELWRLLQEYAHHSRILIDTGGVNPYNQGDLRELAEYVKLDRSIEPILVASAGSDSAEADDMARAFAPLGVRRILVTRIDAARRYGSVLTAAHSGKFAFSHASNSSRIIGEFVTFDPVTLTQLLLRYKEKDAA